VVAGRERVRTDEDASLRLVAEALIARVLVHLEAIGLVRRAVAEANAVVAREIRRRLRRGDQVVARDAVVERTRQRALPHLRAELAAELDRPLHRLAHAGLD